MRVLLTVLLLLTLAFAGCASNGGDGGNGDGPGTESTSGSKSATGSSASGTGTGAPSENHPPTGTISALVNGTSVRFDLTGSDADGDAMTWNLTFGDGNQTQGTTLPANATKVYPVGQFTAVFNLTDGQIATSYNVSINITAPPAPVNPPFTASGGYAAGGPGQACSPVGALYALGPDDGVTHSQVDVPAETGGKAYTVTVQATAPSAGITVSHVAGQSITGGDTNFPSAGPTSLSGTIPAGTTALIISTCGGGQVTWTLAVP